MYDDRNNPVIRYCYFWEFHCGLMKVVPRYYVSLYDCWLSIVDIAGCFDNQLGSFVCFDGWYIPGIISLRFLRFLLRHIFG